MAGESTRVVATAVFAFTFAAPVCPPEGVFVCGVAAAVAGFLGGCFSSAGFLRTNLKCGLIQYSVDRKCFVVDRLSRQELHGVNRRNAKSLTSIKLQKQYM